MKLYMLLKIVKWDTAHINKSICLACLGSQPFDVFQISAEPFPHLPHCTASSKKWYYKKAELLQKLPSSLELTHIVLAFLRNAVIVSQHLVGDHLSTTGKINEGGRNKL